MVKKYVITLMLLALSSSLSAGKIIPKKVIIQNNSRYKLFIQGLPFAPQQETSINWHQAHDRNGSLNYQLTCWMMPPKHKLAALSFNAKGPFHKVTIHNADQKSSEAITVDFNYEHE